VGAWFERENQRLVWSPRPWYAPVMEMTLSEAINGEKAERFFRWNRGQIAKND
jgi:hypothetical protein